MSDRDLSAIPTASTDSPQLSDADVALLDACDQEAVLWRAHAGSVSYGRRVEGVWTTCTPAAKRLVALGLVRREQGYLGRDSGPLLLTPEGRLARRGF